MPPPRPRRLRALELASVVCLGTAPTGTADHRVLFIGNSFTAGGGADASVPEMFEALSRAGHHEDTTAEMVAVPGADLGFHLQNAATLSAIAPGLWTDVVLQDFSTMTTHLGNVENTLKNGSALYDLIESHTPAARVLLYETWSRAAANPLITGTSSATTFASTDEMQSEIRNGYGLLARRLNDNPAHTGNPGVEVVPVGDAWQRAGAELPASDPHFRNLYSETYHGNDDGYYLAAAEFYSVIYHESPEGLGKSPEVGALSLNLHDPGDLESVAWQTYASRVSPIPEPGSGLLLVTGAAVALLRRRGGGNSSPVRRVGDI